MLLVLTQSIVSLVCEEKTTALKKTFDNATSLSNKGSLNFIIPDEVLRKNSSFKRSVLQNHFNNDNGNCKACNSLFFSNKRPPILFVENEQRKKDIKYICQVYSDDVRFASVFDTHFRIPVYSAYQIKKEGSSISIERSAVLKAWKYEPQLENKNYKQMRTMEEIDGLTQYDVKNQATHNDYKNSRWDKGHLFPNSYVVSTIVFFTYDTGSWFLTSFSDTSAFSLINLMI